MERDEAAAATSLLTFTSFLTTSLLHTLTPIAVQLTAKQDFPTTAKEHHTEH